MSSNHEPNSNPVDSRAEFQKRLTASAQDFVLGVKSKIEKELRVKIYSIEDLKQTELQQKLDQNGVDAFYCNKKGETFCLGSRVNYSDAAATKPQFSFRFALFDQKKRKWDTNREFARKVEASKNPINRHLFPKLHVESFSKQKGSGDIGWSFAAELILILKFIEENYEDERKVRIYEPKGGEQRKVLSVVVSEFAKVYPVIDASGDKIKS